MNIILKKQLQLQEALNVKHSKVVGELCDEIKDTALFLNQEVIELIEEIAGSRDILKPWKNSYQDLYINDVNITNKVKEEAIDVLCFAMNICLMSGITPENIDEEYSKVYSKNISRLYNGY